MNRNQFETDDWGLGNSDCGIQKRQSAFTLTELLVVITIIAILAGLITGAAVNALNRAKQAAITLEIQQLDGSLEDFKNTYGAYPPNTVSPNNIVRALHFTDLSLMLRKAFPRHREPGILIDLLTGAGSSSLTDGMTGAEALVFWLGGFSADTQYPISGPGGPSYRFDVTNPVEDLTTRNRRYDFDLGRLGPRDSDGSFYDIDNGGEGRFITYVLTINGVDQTRRINFWRYTPSGSAEPIVYFDASRHRAQVPNPSSGTPPFVNNYDPWFYSNADESELRYALKRFNETGGSSRIEFVNQGKFQLLHCGIDDLWGEGFATFSLAEPDGTPKNINEIVKFPTGPFLLDVADTVGNFMQGTLADEQE